MYPRTGIYRTLAILVLRSMLPSYVCSVDYFFGAIIRVFDLMSYLLLIVQSIRWMRRLAMEESQSELEAKHNNDGDVDVINESKTSVSFKGFDYVAAKFGEFKKPDMMYLGNRKNQGHYYGVSHGETEVRETQDVMPQLSRKNSLTAAELKEVADAFIARMKSSFRRQRLESFRARQLEEVFQNQNEETHAAYIADLQRKSVQHITIHGVQN